MLTPSQLKLYELLKTDEQVKKLIEKLEFGTLCNYKPNPDTGRIKCICLGKVYNSSDVNLITKVTRHFIGNIDTNNLKWGQGFEIIGLPLSEHFIRLYCENKGIKLVIQANGVVKTIKFGGKELDKEIITVITNLDNKKSFDNQEDKVYNSICEALNTL